MKLEHQFWAFMRKREEIRLYRLNGLPRDKWTTDPIFQEYSFTNVKRYHDRTTMLLQREFYDKHMSLHPSPVALINASIFRYFGTIESARANGWHETWGSEEYIRLISTSVERMRRGERVFTSAYIVPSCGSTAPKHEVVADIVSGIWRSHDNILDTDSWAIACGRMCDLWGVGSFMAKEVLLDYMLATKWIPNDWETWTPVGPGARRGAAIVKYGNLIKISENEALEVCRELYSRRDEYWPIGFVRLDLTDIQFQLCEMAKYQKVKLGIGRPKRNFHPTIDSITVRRKEEI